MVKGHIETILMNEKDEQAKKYLLAKDEEPPHNEVKRFELIPLCASKDSSKHKFWSSGKVFDI
jgi:hypothetical protein